jgi:hypothetical protein
LSASLFGEIALVDDAKCSTRVARIARVRVEARAIDLEYGHCVRHRRRAPVAVAFPADGREEPARIGGQHSHFGSGRPSCGQRYKPKADAGLLEM